jgi:hypothetical protein
MAVESLTVPLPAELNFNILLKDRATHELVFSYVFLHAPSGSVMNVDPTAVYSTVDPRIVTLSRRAT